MEKRKDEENEKLFNFIINEENGYTTNKLKIALKSNARKGTKTIDLCNIKKVNFIKWKGVGEEAWKEFNRLRIRFFDKTVANFPTFEIPKFDKIPDAFKVTTEYSPFDRPSKPSKPSKPLGPNKEDVDKVINIMEEALKDVPDSFLQNFKGITDFLKNPNLEKDNLFDMLKEMAKEMSVAIKDVNKSSSDLTQVAIDFLIEKGYKVSSNTISVPSDKAIAITKESAIAFLKARGCKVLVPEYKEA